MPGGHGKWRQFELLAKPVVMVPGCGIQVLGGGCYTAFRPVVCFCLESVQRMVGSTIIWGSALSASFLNLVMSLRESASAMALLTPVCERSE